MHIFLTKGLAATDVLRSDVKQGYAWVRRAAHLLSNDDKLSAAEIRQSYETLLAEMEHTPMSSEPLATMLSTFRKVTTSYWPGLFHCYDVPDLPRTNNELEQYLALPAIMNDAQLEENRHLRRWWYVEPFGWSPPSLLVCIPLLDLSFPRLISPDGAPCETS